MPLRYLLDLVIILLCLHNLCIIHEYVLNMDLTKGAKEMIQNEGDNSFGNLKAIVIFYVVESAIKNMQKLQHLDNSPEFETNFNEENIMSDEER